MKLPLNISHILQSSYDITNVYSHSF